MTYLLDTNVLIALAWPGHAFHERVQRWFGRNSAAGWATCPFTQAAFVQIVSNPAFSDRSAIPLEAMESLAITLKHPHHQFWPDDLGVGLILFTHHRRLTSTLLLSPYASRSAPLLWHRRSAFRYLQLLSTSATSR